MAFKKIDWDKVEMKRVNIRVSPAIDTYFTKKSEVTGLSKSALMYMALEHYVIQSNNFLDSFIDSSSDLDSESLLLEESS